jgi:hypothetical protein
MIELRISIGSIGRELIVPRLVGRRLRGGSDGRQQDQREEKRSDEGRRGHLGRVTVHQRSSSKYVAKLDGENNR